MRKIRRALTIWPGEIADNVSRAVGRLPNMAAVNVVREMKLPARRVIMQKVHSSAPVHIVSLVAAGSFLADIIGGDDVGEIRKGL